MRETVRALETGALAEVAIVAFVVAFLAVCAYAFTLSKRQRDEAKNLPLEDAPPAPGTTPEASGDGSSGDGASSDVPTLTL